jgi:ferrochelatase
VAEVKAFQPTRIVVVPLYPQFSTSTTATSLAEFAREARRQNLDVPVDTLCCYPMDAGFIDAMAAKLRAACHGRIDNPRVVFCAHGLPLKTIAAGDPYQWQVERTADAVAAVAGLTTGDWVLSYQSRVGPLEWLGPPIETEIQRAGRDRRPVIVVPIAFVSEHVETLFELDVTMRDLATASGVPRYDRVATVRTDPTFIAGMVGMIRTGQGRGLCSGAADGSGGRICPAAYNKCPKTT